MKFTSFFILSLVLALAISSEDGISFNSIGSVLGNDSIEEYCAYYGYPIESHQITTEDGYILTYHRIQAHGTNISSNGKPVIYLQHGLVDSSFDFIANTEHKAPGFLLANQGYDVWMGNSRGNHYSLGHVSLNWETDPEFWNFSWQNMSKYDLPAAFQYISGVTQAKKIDYIGHSQGTTIMFAALAEQDPVVTNLLGNFIAMGPVAFVSHANAAMFDLVKENNFVLLLKALKINYVLMPNQKENSFKEFVCTYFNSFCSYMDYSLANLEPQTDNLSRFGTLMGHYPDSTSVMVLQHWQQMLKNKNDISMRKFDYTNPLTNLKNYGQISPPDYDLSKITHKVHLIVGEYDRIADPTDATLLYNQLSNAQYYTIKGGHGTFMWANDISYFFEIVNPILHPQVHSSQH